jgi:hypothetical protein
MEKKPACWIWANSWEKKNTQKNNTPEEVVGNSEANILKLMQKATENTKTTDMKKQKPAEHRDGQNGHNPISKS